MSPLRGKVSFRIAAWLLISCGNLSGSTRPLALLPSNPHYFLFRGRPTVLVTSGEHYGALINLDFDYVRYLEELQSDHLNLARLWMGPYREIPGNFKIADNTLAPEPDRFLPPWKRVGQAGSDHLLFDLDAWNPAYFARLHDLAEQASRRGIVLEINLFCAYYEDSMWQASPLNIRNNVNAIGGVPRSEALTLQHPKLVAIEDAMVRKIVSALNGFDNIYYEIANEPYYGNGTRDWQSHISQLISDTEASLPNRHLISQNIANHSKHIIDFDPNVSIFNFHYARPPVAVNENYALNRVIGYNETGLDGQADATYRIQGWDFLTAGGGLYNNLDYSFTVSDETGTFHYSSETPGGGSAKLRHQLGALKSFFDSLDLAHLRPLPLSLHFGSASPASARVLGALGREYVVYIEEARIEQNRKPAFVLDSTPQQRTFSFDLPTGKYKQLWLVPKTGRKIGRATFTHRGGSRTFHSPLYSEDLVLYISSL